MGRGLRIENPTTRIQGQESDTQNATSLHRQYSWVETPIQQKPTHQDADIPPIPPVPQSFESSTNIPSADHLYDQKVETASSHYDQQDPAAVAQVSPILDKVYLTQPQLDKRPTNVIPDENPLTPKSRSNFGHTGYFSTATRVKDDGNGKHSPGQVAHPNQAIKGGTWKHGLCDCGDVGVCCTGLWCPCIVYGKTQYRLSQKSEKKDPTNMLGYETLNGSCAFFAVLCGCNWILAAIQHTRIRKTYDIPGSIASDCVRALCCVCCTLSQDEKEVKFREDHARRFAGPAIGPQYARPDEMVFAPPPV